MPPLEHPDWTTTGTYRWHRKVLEPGWRLKIKGEPGAWFRFVSHVATDDGREWINAVGGTPYVVMDRAFRPDRITVARPPLPDEPMSADIARTRRGFPFRMVPPVAR